MDQDGGGDAQLALAVHHREDGAVEHLVGRFERSLYNYAQRLLLNAEDAQEVVQDTFVRAHRALTQRYSAERCSELSLRSWLFRIARNLALNKSRGKRHQLEEPLTASTRPAQPLVEPVTILHEIDRRQELARLDGALAILPRTSRELVFLRFIEEMSYSEIVRTVGGSETSLRGRVFRALRQLRQALDEIGEASAPSREVSDAV